MKIYIVRHGQSLGNASRVLLGSTTDLDLSELGRLQAKATAEAMRDFPIDIIYTSDLKRAYSTALPHAELHGVSVVPDKAFRECHLGAWEGKSADWCRENYPEEYPTVWGEGFGTFVFPEGESTRGAGERVLKRVCEICRENPDKNILIVSHAIALRSFFGVILNIAPEDVGRELPSITNASYSVCEFDGESFSVLEYSVDKHLEGIGITKLQA